MIPTVNKMSWCWMYKMQDESGGKFEIVLKNGLSPFKVACDLIIETVLFI